MWRRRSRAETAPRLQRRGGAYHQERSEPHSPTSRGVGGLAIERMARRPRPGAASRPLAALPLCRRCLYGRHADRAGRRRRD